MRAAGLIVTAIFAIAGAVSFWPAPSAPLPLHRLGQSVQFPPPLRATDPADVPVSWNVPGVVRRRDTPPEPRHPRRRKESGGRSDPLPPVGEDAVGGSARDRVTVQPRDVLPAELVATAQPTDVSRGHLPSRTLTVDLPPDITVTPDTGFVFVPADMEAGVVERVISLAGRQIVGAVRLTGHVIRGVF